MDDLSSKLSQILNSPEGMNQLRSVASSLGLTGDGNNQNSGLNNSNNNQNNNSNNNSNGNTPDLSAISALLSGMSNNSNNNQNNNSNNNLNGNSPDLSAISSLLSGMSNNQSNNSNGNSGGGFDLSALTSMLSGAVNQNNNSNQSASPLPNIDINMIMKLQQAMSQFSATDKNVELLLALKPHFGDDRRKKVDDAIRIMQLIKLLPLIKESGLFGGGLF